MIDRIAGERGAQRRADAHRAADDAEPEIESSGAAHDVRDHERENHAENGGADAVEHLHGHDQIGIADERKEHAARRQAPQSTDTVAAAAPS